MKRIPGTVWIAVAAFLPLLAQYIGDNFMGEWVAGVLLALSFVSNILKIYVLPKSEPEPRHMSDGGEKQPSALSRFFLGG